MSKSHKKHSAVDRFAVKEGLCWLRYHWALYCICVFVSAMYLYLQCICISDTIEVKPSLASQCWTVCHSLQNCCRGLNVHYLPPVDWPRSMTVATIFYILSLQYPPSNFFKSNFVPFQSQRNSISFIKKYKIMVINGSKFNLWIKFVRCPRLVQ